MFTKKLSIYLLPIKKKNNSTNPQLVSSLNLQGVQVCQITFRIHHLDSVAVYGPFCFLVVKNQVSKGPWKVIY